MPDHPHAALDLRAVDCLIAEKVFDRYVCRTEADIPDGWRLDDRQSLPGYCDGTFVYTLPRYTTSWDAAGQVVERLAQMEPARYLAVSRRRDGWNATVWKYCGAHGDRCEALDRPARLFDITTGPLAICLAALAALGVEP